MKKTQYQVKLILYEIGQNIKALLSGMPLEKDPIKEITSIATPDIANEVCELLVSKATEVK
jgi:hypothetical protein